MKNSGVLLLLLFSLFSCTKDENKLEILSISLDKKEVTLLIGEECRLTTSVTPSGISIPKCIWASSNEAIVSVDEGVVQAKSEGVAMVKVFLNSDVSASCVVRVTPKVATSIKFSLKTIDIYAGERLYVDYSIIPADAVNRNVIYSTTNPNVIRIQDNQLLPISKGVAGLIATIKDTELSDTCIVTVSDETFFNFENWEEHKRFQYDDLIGYDIYDKSFYEWGSTNQFQALFSQKNYPICRTLKSKSGKYAAEIKTTKGPGEMLNLFIPVLGGCLYTGSLNPLGSLENTLKSYRFGKKFNKKPLRLKGYYSYKPGGGEYIGSDGIVKVGVKDAFAIYAVFYSADETTRTLDGSNILTHPNIISIAKLSNNTATADFVSFDIPFEYKTSKYEETKLAIVLLSSVNGLYNEGIIGSELLVDELEVITEDIK